MAASPGCVDSPAVFDATVRDSLDPLMLPEGCTLLQYADDLLLTANDEAMCKAGFVCLLQHLNVCGFKAALDKLQCCQTKSCLSFTLSKRNCRLSQGRIQLNAHD